MSPRLTKEMRLRKRADFVDVQQRGTKVTGRFFVALAVTHAGRRPVGRLGITVSRRVGNAVTRNRIRRHVREWMRSHGWVPGFLDVVLVAKASAATADRGGLSGDLSALQRRLPC